MATKKKAAGVVEACRHWRRGLCAVTGGPTYCPQARAAACVPRGSCCHDPQHERRVLLLELIAAGESPDVLGTEDIEDLRALYRELPPERRSRPL